jgi:hypothetical protein
MSAPRYRRTDRNLHWHLLLAGLAYCVVLYFVVRYLG